MGKKLRILIADDSETDAQLLLRTLRAGGLDPEYERVDTAEGTRTALDSGPWDIMLCDYTMPQFGALDALEIVQREDADLPVIIISGTIGEDVAVAAMRAGARDYFMKGRLDRLSATIERELRGAEERRAHKLAKAGFIESEERYRRLFESAKDGILLLDFETGKITDANPFMAELLGYSRDAFIGKYLWEVGFFKDTQEAKKGFLQLQTNSYIRYTDLPLETKDGKKAPVEFVSNVYQAGGKKVIQCNIRDISERKQAETALLASEDRYHTLFEASSDGNLIADLETGMFKYANPAICRMLGYAREELTLLGVGDIHSKDALPFIRAEFEAMWRGDKTLSSDLPCLRKDGTILHADVTAARLVIDGRACVVGVFRDITARKKAEAALSESEKKYRTLFDQANDSIILLELPPEEVPVIRDVNEAALRMHGYTREELLGKPITFLDEKTSPAIVTERIGRVRSAKASLFEARHRRKDGSAFDLEVSVRELETGGKNMMLDISRDITERKKAATELSEAYQMQVMLNTLRKESLAALPLQNKLVAHLATLLSIPWLAVEPKGAVFLVTGKNLNLAVQQGLAPALLVSCAKVPFGKCLCGRAAESGKVVAATGVGAEHEITYEGMIPHGHYCAPITAAGATLGVLNLYLKAGTELTMKQKDFIQSATDVIASDIIHARVEDQLVQSQKMEAVGQLAGGVAHDFNNILMAIMGYSEFVRAALPAGDPKLVDVEQVLLAGERAAVLTQQLLTFSRKQVVQFSELNLDDIVPGTLKMLRRMLPENIEFRTSFNSAPAKVPANRGQLEQVVLNLAVNARDAMPDGGTLTFETAPAELDADYAASHPGVVPGHYVMLAVSDTSCGMSPDVVARIFEPFFTTKEQGKGTGLGLSTVYGIVRQSGGSIYVYSEPGKGTTFKVYLPIAVEETEKKPAEKPALSTYRGTETILLVEDDEAVRKFVFRALSQNGYNVLQAATPGEAVKHCELRKDIRLMFTDMVMPQMNGYELSKVVTAMLPAMKVVFMSGYTDNALNRKDLGPGVVLLEKPLKVETILRTAREILKGGSQ